MVNHLVKKHMDRPTKIAGLMGLVSYMCLGYFLKIMETYNYLNWKKDYELLRHYLEKAHMHGMLLGFMLLFYSFFIEVSDLSDNLKKVGTYLAIGGYIIMPLTTLTTKMPASLGVTGGLVNHLSVVMLIASMGVLAWGHLSR